MHGTLVLMVPRERMNGSNVVAELCVSFCCTPQERSGTRLVPCFGTSNIPHQHLSTMNNLFRGLLAGAAAYKWGGGCLGTVLVFLLIYWLLGSC